MSAPRQVGCSDACGWVQTWGDRSTFVHAEGCPNDPYDAHPFIGLCGLCLSAPHDALCPIGQALAVEERGFEACRWMFA